jgi:hypothetical protein
MSEMPDDFIAAFIWYAAMNFDIDKHNETMAAVGLIEPKEQSHEAE